MAVRLFRKVKPLADLFSPMARNNKIHDHFFFFQAPIVIVIKIKQTACLPPRTWNLLQKPMDLVCCTAASLRLPQTFQGRSGKH